MNNDKSVVTRTRVLPQLLIAEYRYSHFTRLAQSFEQLAAACVLFFSMLLLSGRAEATISYVQGNSTSIETQQSTMTVTLGGAQTAGDLNVVKVAWSDTTATIQSVVDSKGNTYTLAAGPTAIAGDFAQSLYYAKNIAVAAAGANTVTVTFSKSVWYPDVIVAEYGGLDPANPLDVTQAATGYGTTADSGSATTTNANDLLIGASSADGSATGAGSGYTSRIITSNGTILEDRIVTIAGAYNATAPYSSSGSWVMQLAAFKAASGGGDIQPPTAPTGLTATATSSAQINLSWTASTDNVGVTGYLLERCAGTSCTTFAQIATPTTTSYSDTGLSASTSYSYRVRATDAANNVSGYSSTASATTQASDTQPPTAPTGLTATAASSTQINLSWTASTDNVGVTGYLLERCTGASCNTFAQIGTPTTTNYSDTGLTAATSYSYRVRAKDAANNLSAYSSVASATTQSGVANIAYVQSNSTSVLTQQSTVAVTFSAAQNAGDLNVVSVSWADTTATVLSVVDGKGNSYTRAVGPTSNGGFQQSLYYAKNIAAATAGSNTVTVTFSASIWYPELLAAEYSGIDTSNPLELGRAGTGFGTAANSGTITTTNANDLLVGASTANTNISSAGSGYTSRVLNGALLEDRIVSSAGSYNATATVSGSSSWAMQIAAFKAANSGGGADTQPPTVPAGLSATTMSSAQINLSWTASTDNVGVTGYLLERCSGTSCTTFAQIATPTTTSYSDAGLTAATSYSYRVRATDAAGNLSTYSSTASATTLAPADTQPPTAPIGLTATTVSSTQINLSWTASTDNVGVTGYLLERCMGASCSTFAQIATLTTTTYSDTGLSASTSYSYRVRATDAANNLSGYSNVVTVTTQAPPDTQAPTAPTGLSATAASTSQINLSWSASTDNVGVTNYLIERCSGSGCTGFAQVGTSTTTVFTDLNLQSFTAYTYRVRATDAAGNLSAYSLTASVGTLSSVVTVTYTYDNLKRVTRADSSDGSSVVYTYDANGNVQSITRTAP